MNNILLMVISVPNILTCGKAWRLGGDGQSLFRNPLVPVLITINKWLLSGFEWWVLLYIPLMWGAIQMFSYGLSSPIHKYWVWVFKKGENGDSKVVEVCTRATCGFMWSLPALVFAWKSNNWIGFCVYVVFLTIANGLIGGLVKDVKKSETSVGQCVALAVFV